MPDRPEHLKELDRKREDAAELVQIRIKISKVQERIDRQPHKAKDLRDCIEQLKAREVKLLTRAADME